MYKDKKKFLSSRLGDHLNNILVICMGNFPFFSSQNILEKLLKFWERSQKAVETFIYASSSYSICC